MAGRNFLSGNGGNDTLAGGGDVDILDGGDGDDVLQGGTESDRYINLNLTGSDDIIQDDGGVGDRIEIEALSELVSSSRVGDNLVLKFSNQASVTVINHFTGNGAIEFLKAGLDQLVLATGMAGGSASGIVSGTARADQLSGGGGDDLLFGERGNDQLSGDEGNDSLFDGDGRDVLSGGQGADRFHLVRDRWTDRIVDFEAGIDTILFDAAAFGIDRAAPVESWLFFDIDDVPAEAPAFLVGADGKILFFGQGAGGHGGLVADLAGVSDLPTAGDFELY